MQIDSHDINHRSGRKDSVCFSHLREHRSGISRRSLLGGIGGAAAVGGLAMMAASRARAAEAVQSDGSGLPVGTPLKVKPALMYSIPQRREKTSWRPYGGILTEEDLAKEVARVEEDLAKLSSQAEFNLEMQPLAMVAGPDQAKSVASSDADAILLFAAGGDQAWLETIAASGKPAVMFVRHKSGPIYLYYEIVHWRWLRKNEDLIKETRIGVEDVVVDDPGEILWRLRALYGLKNAKGTRCVAIGGLRAYSVPGQQKGPEHVKQVWGYELITVPDEDVAEQLAKARKNESAMDEVRRQVDEFLAQPNVYLGTEKRFVENSFLALRVFKEIMKEKGATNLGVAHCMGSLIGLLDTAPCLVLAMLNDEGLTAFCHTDYTHTAPGVLMRWISGKPSFVCNTHFPHDGVITLAHCAAPRRMNGRDYAPTKIMTHFESDHGTATKVEYDRGQVITVIIPNLNCTKWFGFRGKILDSPNYDMCRSQMDVAIDGDWRRMAREMQGFHAVVTYGDYLREVGYVLGKLGIEWQGFSENA
ncbi:MAG: sugar isomerase [Phycisphaerae bacterium]